jgi:aryl-alcohol dehydrogenase-like predicted oxidoreductase
VTLSAATVEQYIETSPMYGGYWRVVGGLIEELQLRLPVFMATRGWTPEHSQGIDQMNDSSRKMRVSVIDLMQVHNLVGWRNHAKSLHHRKQLGEVHSTITTQHPSGAYVEPGNIMKRRHVDFMPFNYSIAKREAEQRLLHAALHTAPQS